MYRKADIVLATADDIFDRVGDAKHRPIQLGSEASILQDWTVTRVNNIGLAKDSLRLAPPKNPLQVTLSRNALNVVMLDLMTSLKNDMFTNLKFVASPGKEGMLLVSRMVWGKGLVKAGSIHTGYILGCTHTENKPPFASLALTLGKYIMPIAYVPVRPGTFIAGKISYTNIFIDFSSRAEIAVTTTTEVLWKKFSQTMTVSSIFDKPTFIDLIAREVEFAAQYALPEPKST